MIKAELIRASVIKGRESDDGSRLYTFRLVYPRFIHAEIMTHGTFARNASSSRAIPAKEMRAWIQQNPAKPLSWGARQAGMQQGADIKGMRANALSFVWWASMQMMLFASWLMTKLGVHKAIANRLTEPFSHMEIVATMSGASLKWFLLQRADVAAEPSIDALARCMAECVADVSCVVVDVGEWHEWHNEFSAKQARKIEDPLSDYVLGLNVGIAAKASYRRAKDASEEDLCRIARKLITSTPPHLSPLEHVAMASTGDGRGRHGSSWVTLRQMFEEQSMVSTTLREQIKRILLEEKTSGVRFENRTSTWMEK